MPPLTRKKRKEEYDFLASDDKGWTLGSTEDQWNDIKDKDCEGRKHLHGRDISELSICRTHFKRKNGDYAPQVLRSTFLAPSPILMAVTGKFELGLFAADHAIAGDALAIYGGRRMYKFSTDMQKMAKLSAATHCASGTFGKIYDGAVYNSPRYDLLIYIKYSTLICRLVQNIFFSDLAFFRD